MKIKARKKPVIVEAMEFTDETKNQVHSFVRCTTAVDWEDGKPVLKIQTPEGIMTTRLGDYVIKDVNGYFYPFTPDIFHKTYEIIDNKDEKIDIEFKARKKPVIVEVMEFTDKSKDQVHNFIRCDRSPDWEDGKPVLKIQTPEGIMTTRLGDYVIKDVNGYFYPCNPSIFEKTYEIIED